MEERIWEYIDGVLGESDRAFVAKQIATQDEWKKKYEELLGLLHMLNTEFTLDQPSMRFTRNVMEEIARYHIAPATKDYINKKIIYGIGGFFAVLIIGMLVFAFSNTHLNSGDASTQSLTNEINRINVAPITSGIFLKLFLVVNAIVALFLFDKIFHAKAQRRLLR